MSALCLLVVSVTDLNPQALFLPFIDLFQSAKYVWVAFSGGVDSTVLLSLAVEVLGKEKVKAVHINHHLHPEANKWEARAKSMDDQDA